MAGRTGENINSVRRELANVEGAGLVRCVPVANLKYYSINRSSSIYSEFRSIFLRQRGLAAVIGDRFSRGDGIGEAFIVGSFVAGEERSTSDIDLFVVGDIDESAVMKSIGELEEFLGREVNLVLMSRSEFDKRMRTKEPFVARLLSSPRIPLVGSCGDEKGRAGEEGSDEDHPPRAEANRGPARARLKGRGAGEHDKGLIA